MQDATLTMSTQTPADSASLLALIRNRRSVGKVTAEVPDRALLRTMLEAATWAPNHHLTEPWRFFVLEGAARERLGEVMGRIAAKRESGDEARAQAAERAASKTLRAPYIVAVAVEPSASVPEIEEISAGSAAVQNMLLAAEALGLAAIWRSGWMCFEPEIREHFGLSDAARMLGFVYVGYAAMEPPRRERRSVDEVTTWLDS
jgi:nitroreductase